MLRYAFVTTILLFGAAMPARAQNCLHQQNETAEDRIRREQAFQFARRLNAAQHMMLPSPQGQRYRHPDALRNLRPCRLDSSSSFTPTAGHIRFR